ncbi:MAG: hypothetical protein WBA29_13490 [Xanthobacteraceae bacterium]
MAKTRDPDTGGGLRSLRAYLRPTATTGRSRLANWPPPYRANESKPVIMKHQPGEAPKRAKPRGWRLTRALFSEFADD